MSKLLSLFLSAQLFMSNVVIFFSMKIYPHWYQNYSGQRPYTKQSSITYDRNQSLQVKRSKKHMQPIFRDKQNTMKPYPSPNEQDKQSNLQKKPNKVSPNIHEALNQIKRVMWLFRTHNEFYGVVSCALPPWPCIGCKVRKG